VDIARNLLQNSLLLVKNSRKTLHHLQLLRLMLQQTINSPLNLKLRDTQPFFGLSRESILNSMEEEQLMKLSTGSSRDQDHHPSNSNPKMNLKLKKQVTN
jgi:hypothetical protein